MSTIPHKLHLYYHTDGNNEYGAFLDKQLDGTWPRCTGVDGKKCQNYAHPDLDRFCPACGLADANDALKAVMADKRSEQSEIDDATNFMLYCENIVLYGAATKENESEAWGMMMLARERAIKY